MHLTSAQYFDLNSQRILCENPANNFTCDHSCLVNAMAYVFYCIIVLLLYIMVKELIFNLEIGTYVMLIKQEINNTHF